MNIPARIVAEVARAQFKAESSRQTFKVFRSETLGKLRACASITGDIEIRGWANESAFFTFDYADRHNLNW